MPETGAEAAATPATPGTVSGRRRLPWWGESLLLLVIAVVIALVIKTFLVQAFYIPSKSMEPGLIKNDRILVQKWSYWFGSPQRGDVVVFSDPGDWLPPEERSAPPNAVSKGLEKVGLYPSGGHLVKRVVGVGGDTIHCCNPQGQLVINGVAVDESSFVQRLSATCDGPMVLPSCSARGWTVGPVPAGTLFVMGDNRSQSGDSSAHLTCTDGTCTGADAFVPVSDVVGKVFVRLWPLDRFRFVSRPDVFADVPDAG